MMIYEMAYNELKKEGKTKSINIGTLLIDRMIKIRKQLDKKERTK